MIGAKFTLHGVSQPVHILTEMKATGTPGVVRLTGSFTIQQTDYGIKPYSAAGGAIGIENELTIYGDLILRLDAGK
jgi:polyisoprenoid-binding protein YceI